MSSIITRKFEFDYGHRVLGHEGKCASLHGHRGVAEITIESEELDTVGRVLDFGVIKELVGGWIDDNWDHTMLLHPEDPLVKLTREMGIADKVMIEGPRSIFVMPNDALNPTAENMVKVLRMNVKYILTTDERLIEYSLRLIRIRFWETPNCSAEWSA